MLQRDEGRSLHAGDAVRRASKPQWLYANSSTAAEHLIGLGLGSDMCAEHEWGVAQMQRTFACDSKKDGIERRQITELPNDLSAFSGRGYDAIMLDHAYTGTRDDRFKNVQEQHLRLHTYPGASTFVTAWDEGTFGVCAYGKKDNPDRERVRVLWEAFQHKDIAIWPNVGVFHLGAGLLMVMVSKVPEDKKAELLNHDLSLKRLDQRVGELGIVAELKEAGKEYFSLSPRWTDEKESDVRFWLNPREQRTNNAGWYTAEELRQWIKGTGPVPKK